jgi:BMFP domain-containing protein YqiC
MSNTQNPTNTLAEYEAAMDLLIDLRRELEQLRQTHSNVEDAYVAAMECDDPHGLRVAEGRLGRIEVNMRQTRNEIRNLKARVRFLECELVEGEQS